MSELDEVTRIPEVKTATVCDFSGAFHGGYKDPDGESVAAVMAVVAVTLQQIGEQSGLGDLRSISIATPQRGRVLVRRGQRLLTATIEPVSALPNLAQTLEGGH